MNLIKQLDSKKIPRHVAVIMDGNGRWAEKRGNHRLFGHRNAIKAVRETIEAAGDIGIEHLTLYAFSKENWNRPKTEVKGLMQLLVKTMNSEINTLIKNKIRLNIIGDIESLPEEVKKGLFDTMKKTSMFTKFNLNIALSYGARWEILEAVKKIAEDVKKQKINPKQLDETVFSNYLATAGIPDPELLIRTGGEKRISNFLLWQLSYTELYFTEQLWPDFRKKNFFEAILDYQQRERRFGKTGKQIKQNKQ